MKYGQGEVFTILFLYNIAVAQLTDKYYKFPFDLFRKVKSWNIEHIYAKNSKGFETQDDLKKWYEEIQQIIEDKEIDFIANDEFQKLWNAIDLDNLEKSNDLVKKIELQLQEIFEKDSLSNLCLLDQVTNIQVSNKVFRDKREMVLELNYKLDEKAYVPIASKMVFQKSVTPSKKVQMNYWNSMDKEAYLEDIQVKIKEFLKIETV